MEAPIWICKHLSKIDPNARLGYGASHPALPPHFSVVKLYRARDTERFAYSPDEWHNRGPIWNAAGSIRPDWDMLSRVPCSLVDVSTSTFQDGRVVEILADWLTDRRARKYNALVKLASDQDTALDDLSRKMGDYAAWHNRHSYKIGEQESAEPVAKKFISKSSTARYHDDCGSRNRYWQELDMLVCQWRQQGWRPPQERK